MKLFLAHLTGLLVVVVCVLLAGCEAEPADKAQITITPASATLAYGESVEFTATGWRDYTWSLQDASLGTLSRTKGDSTVLWKGIIIKNYLNIVSIFFYKNG